METKTLSRTTVSLPNFDQICRVYPSLRQLVAEAEDYQLPDCRNCGCLRQRDWA